VIGLYVTKVWRYSATNAYTRHQMAWVVSNSAWPLYLAQEPAIGFLYEGRWKR